MRDWMIEADGDLSRLVKVGVTTESHYLDFKKALDQGSDWQVELGRDVAQFANARGGCLLIGVSERKDEHGVKIATAFDGILDPDRCRESIEQAIQNSLVPSDVSRTISFVRSSEAPGVTMVAVNVPASQRLVWVTPTRDGKGLDVPIRTNHGKAYMRPGEIERQWVNTLRSAQIAFHDAIADIRKTDPSEHIAIEIVGGVVRGRPNSPPSHEPSTGRLVEHDARAFTLDIRIGPTEVRLRAPFELLSSAWVDDIAVLHLLFLAPIVFDSQTKRLRFDPFGHYSRT